MTLPEHRPARRRLVLKLLLAGLIATVLVLALGLHALGVPDPKIADARHLERERALASKTSAAFANPSAAFSGPRAPFSRPSGDPRAASDEAMSMVETYISNRPGRTGVYALETGAEALRARAWLVDNARQSIEAQYFIWSTDNIGTLAAEALLRAADRGVKVRVIVDDLLIDAQASTLIGLVRHPNVDVRIYNPRHKVGVPFHLRLWHMVSDFRSFNQRMHDKSFIVDGKVAIIGGRNMAAEYFDYSREFNFRDRDALILGQAVREIGANFENFWASPLSQPIARLIARAASDSDPPLMRDDEVTAFRAALAQHAASPENFEPEVRRAISGTPGEFERLARDIHWGEAQFIHDSPGKAVAGRFELDAGGKSAEALAALVEGARGEVLIQTPYLVLSDQAFALFRSARDRGVRIRINTNSLAATDNVEAFSGYLWQRRTLLAMGVEISEYRPDAAVQQALMRRDLGKDRTPPKTSLHAKTMIVDADTTFIGTYNLDPRSQNLNTEIGVVVRDGRFAGKVREAILADMAPGSSWDAAADEPDSNAPWQKRLKAQIFSWLPMRAIL